MHYKGSKDSCTLQSLSEPYKIYPIFIIVKAIDTDIHMYLSSVIF